jgi:hypothetical protein
MIEGSACWVTLCGRLLLSLIATAANHNIHKEKQRA